MPSPLVKTPAKHQLWVKYEPPSKRPRYSCTSTTTDSKTTTKTITTVENRQEPRFKLCVTLSPKPKRQNLLGRATNELKLARNASFGGRWRRSWLVAAVTRDITDLSATNTRAGLADQHVNDSLKMFFSQHAQPFSLRFYVARLVQYYHCSSSAFVAALVYLDRVHVRCRELALVDMNAHRLIATALVLAAKYLDDEVCRNSYYARVAGLAVTEFNELESIMLNVLEWRLAIAPPLFAKYERSLLEVAAIDCADV